MIPFSKKAINQLNLKNKNVKLYSTKVSVCKSEIALSTHQMSSKTILDKVKNKEQQFHFHSSRPDNQNEDETKTQNKPVSFRENYILTQKKKKTEHLF